jgi:mono/diheme cytochrome c family protein
LRSAFVVAALALSLGTATGYYLGPEWPTEMLANPGAVPLAPPPVGALSLAAEPPLSRDDAGEKLTNPLPASPEVLAQGKQLYDVYCALCHGAAGKADGKVGAKFGFPIPPLDDAAVVERKDGYLYGTIREGGFIMPKYAEVMTPAERWAVVHYMRALQKP